MESWMNRPSRTGRVMVATNALGLGVDVADVRLVVHAGMPRAMRLYMGIEPLTKDDQGQAAPNQMNIATLSSMSMVGCNESSSVSTRNQSLASIRSQDRTDGDLRTELTPR